MFKVSAVHASNNSDYWHCFSFTYSMRLCCYLYAHTDAPQSQLCLAWVNYQKQGRPKFGPRAVSGPWNDFMWPTCIFTLAVLAHIVKSLDTTDQKDPAVGPFTKSFKSSSDKYLVHLWLF
ncbi:hypothetical protein CHARACLAT_031654 [Characodon lateralis]|uniref:Uncharacterized protein n=1 Tax=Characodon lateralis TaxID=208331 RepID=A0ABU7DNB8_9TELE|nr:hypothetical protein [Characodon lateralis]